MESNKTFYAKYASQQTKMFVTLTIVVSIISASINLVTFLFGDIIAIVSTIFYLSAAMVLLFFKNWMLPMVITIYSLFFSVMIFDGVSLVAGIITFIFGFICIIKVRKVNAAYERYCKQGTIPENSI